MSALIIGALGAQINAAPSKGTRLTSGTSFTATVTGWHRVVCQGGGGAGSGNLPNGGDAGMYCEAWHYLTAGTAYAYTIGAGGTGAANANGGNGGSTTFTGPNITQTALGGSGGIISGTTHSNTARLDGVTTASAPAANGLLNCIYGANGATTIGASRDGGYCGFRAGGLGNVTQNTAGGGASFFAAGGNGATSAAAGSAGALGSGGGSSGSTAFAGGAGGAGLIEIY